MLRSSRLKFSAWGLERQLSGLGCTQATLAEDPTPNSGSTKQTVTLVPGDPMSLVSEDTYTHIDIYTHTHNFKNKKLF